MEQQGTTGDGKPVRGKWWAILIGSGLALLPIHNEFLTNLVTNSQNEVVFFVPAFGYMLLILGASLFCLYNWERVKEVGFGAKRVVIPLAVIVIAIGLSGIQADGIKDIVAPLGMGLALFAAYLAARVLGKDVFLPLAVGAGIASIGIIAHQVWSPGVATGGFVFDGNYDIATGYILLGAALFFKKGQWILALLGTAALLLSGSAEFAFCIGVVGLVILIRERWSGKLAIAIGTLMIVGAVFFASGHGIPTWSRMGQGMSEISDLTNGTALQDLGMGPLGGRWVVIKEAMTHIKPLGDGFSLTKFGGTVHNVPLIIIQQLGWPGILAALAWLWVGVWCLVKTKLKYVWALILALSVFDHFIWTQFAPLFWLTVGVSTIPNVVDSDLIFRRKVETSPPLGNNKDDSSVGQ